MSLLFDIIFWAIFLLGATCLAYISYYFIWPKIAWRLKPKAYRKALDKRTAEARFKAKAKGQQAYYFPNAVPRNKQIKIWASSRRMAQKKYNGLSREKRKKTEIF